MKCIVESWSWSRTVRRGALLLAFFVAQDALRMGLRVRVGYCGKGQDEEAIVSQLADLVYETRASVCCSVAFFAAPV